MHPSSFCLALSPPTVQVSELKFPPGTNILFHMFDAPGHGCAFHNMGSKHDWFHDQPIPGREDPALEIKRALTILKKESNFVK